MSDYDSDVRTGLLVGFGLAAAATGLVAWLMPPMAWWIYLVIFLFAGVLGANGAISAANQAAARQDAGRPRDDA